MAEVVAQSCINVYHYDVYHYDNTQTVPIWSLNELFLNFLVDQWLELIPRQ